MGKGKMNGDNSVDSKRQGARQRRHHEEPESRQGGQQQGPEYEEQPAVGPAAFNE